MTELKQKKQLIFKLKRTAAEKSQLAANAIKDAHTVANELANLQELLDRQTSIEEDAKKSIR